MVNGSMGLSACMDRAAVVARAQLEECVSSTVLLWPWWACLEELLVLLVAPATVVGAKQRRWRSDEVRCGKAGLQWASSSAKVSTMCLSSGQNQSGVNIAFSAT